MHILKVVKEDLAVFFGSRMKRIEIAAILLVPLLYGGVYLAAFWDPYGHTEKLAVAVVSEDAGAEDDGTVLNLGDELKSNLASNDDLEWIFVDTRDEAVQGVESSSYYAAIVVPEDFSESILAIKDGERMHPQIEYISNDKVNYTVSLLSKRAANSVINGVNTSVVATLSQTLVESLEDVRSGFADASSGAAQLSDGMALLLAKLPSLRAGIEVLDEGSATLMDKMGAAESGSLELQEGLYTLRDQLPELQEGTAALYEGSSLLHDKMLAAADGAADLSDGAALLNDQMPTLADGARDLNDGASRLSDGLNELNGKLPELLSGASAIAGGANDLHDGLESAASASESLLSAMNLSEGLLQPLYEDAQTAAQGMNTGLTGVGALLQAVKSGPECAAVPAVSAGIDKILAGITSMQSMMGGGDSEALLTLLKTTTLQQVLLENLNSIRGGIAQIAAVQAAPGTPLFATGGSSATQLATALYYMDSMIGAVEDNGDAVNLLVIAQINEKVIAGTTALDSGIDQLAEGSSELAEGADTLFQSVPDLIDGTQALEEGAQNLQSGTERLQTSVPTLANGVGQLNDGASDLKVGMSRLEGASGTLNEGIDELNGSMPSLQSGVAQLAEGSLQLSSGLGKLTDAAGALKDGLDTVSSKMPELESGTQQLYDGTRSLEDALADAQQQIADSLLMTPQEVTNYASAPVTLQENKIYTVEKYGEGMAHYFNSLGLWVGSLVTFFIIGFKKKRELADHGIAYVLGKFISISKVAVMQSVILTTVMIKIGLRPTHVAGFYLFNALVALTFGAIMQCLIYVGDNVGRLMAMILLTLQLTSSNGSFPVELEPVFFQRIHSYLPFSYSISGTRELTYGINGPVLMHDIRYLVLALLTALAITCLYYSFGIGAKKAQQDGTPQAQDTLYDNEPEMVLRPL